LARNKDLTGTRLLTVHNLTYMERLTAGARDAIADGRYKAYSDAVLGGTPPWAA
jgi:tRNA-guanine family transglycosylase